MNKLKQFLIKHPKKIGQVIGYFAALLLWVLALMWFGALIPTHNDVSPPAVMKVQLDDGRVVLCLVKATNLDCDWFGVTR